MRGRQSRAMLQAMGVDELVVDSAEAYVDAALALGMDAGRRRALSERITGARGVLFERDETVRALEDFLERAARGA